MHNDVNQKISLFIDDELDYGDTLQLLNQLRNDETLRDRLVRYQAVSHALKTERYYKLRPDFSEKIAQQIRQEPAYLLPKPKEKPQGRKLFAIAASALVATVLVGEIVWINRTVNEQPLATAMIVPPNQLSTASVQSPHPSTQPKRPPVNSRFNDYLQAHNNSIYTNGEVNFQPYAKVASFR